MSGACGGDHESPGAQAARPRRWRRNAAWLVPLLFAAPCAYGLDPATYLYTPVVNGGERELSWYGGVASSGREATPEIDNEAGIGASFTNNWHTEFDARWRQSDETKTYLDSVSSENILQLAPTGKWPLEVALLGEVEWGRRRGEGLTVRPGLLLQRDFGRWEANFNAILSKRAYTQSPEPLRTYYQAQIKYRYSREFEFGAQAFGQFGHGQFGWPSYPEQKHRIGPAIMGERDLRRGRSLEYNAAVLFGTTPQSSRTALRAQLDYDF